jgi:cysteinyl-tRNA synthetase
MTQNMAAAVATARCASGLLPLLSSPTGAHLPQCQALPLILLPCFNRLFLHPAKLLSTTPFTVFASSTALNGVAAGKARELHLYNTKSR